ncbi:MULTISPECIES: DUF3617 family protein [Halomonadaceae]|uniref:DUF3617 domain-containing protein n=1 Tax=Halomonadaceae TaxID=28256 RepID=UPI001598342B|nr:MULTISPECIES: DUF3617 family protein [Halomonas]QJQ94949.1 DUF3617 family protein [Halomonas sp. PA5]
MLQRRLTVVVVATIVLWPIAALADTPNLAPGEWEFTSIATVIGDFPVPEWTGTHTACLTAEAIHDAHSDRLEHEQGCEFLEREAGADEMTYVMSCQSDEGELMIMGEMRFQQDRYEGTTRIQTATPMGDITMTTLIEGRRLNDC